MRSDKFMLLGSQILQYIVIQDCGIFIFCMLVLLSVLTKKDGVKCQSAVMQGNASAIF